MGQAIEQIKKMLEWRLSDEPYDKTRDLPQDPEERKKIGCRVFLACTSNQTSCGNREIIKWLMKHKLIDVYVTTCGGVEEDFMKVLRDFKLGSFELRGKELREKTLNRTGNLIVPNEHYAVFEQWLHPIIDEAHDEQDRTGTHFTPSRLIWKMGERINSEDSIFYWAWKNKIPCFCPAITDGSIGDQLYFHSIDRPGFILDLVGDINAMDGLSISAPKCGAIIVGGGVPKHHVLNACILNGAGADFAVYISTAQEFDGSDSGARPDEAVSWGKIAMHAKPVKVYAESTTVFPIIVRKSFLEIYKKNPKFYDDKKNPEPFGYNLSMDKLNKEKIDEKNKK